MIHYEEQAPKGEFVIVISGKTFEEIRDEEREFFQKLSLEEHMIYYEEKGYGKKEAMKQVARDLGISKRDVYQKLLHDH